MRDVIYEHSCTMIRRLQITLSTSNFFYSRKNEKQSAIVLIYNSMIMKTFIKHGLHFLKPILKIFCFVSYLALVTLLMKLLSLSGSYLYIGKYLKLHKHCRKKML